MRSSKRGLLSLLILKPHTFRLSLLDTFGVPIAESRLFILSHYSLGATFHEHFKGNKVATSYFLGRIKDNKKGK